MSTLGVFLRAQQDLWRSVPPRGHVFGHNLVGLLSFVGNGTSQTEISNFHKAFGIQKQIGWFHVPVT